MLEEGGVFEDEPSVTLAESRAESPQSAEGAETLSAGNGHLDITSPFGACTYSERSPMLAQFPHLTMKRKERGEQDNHYCVAE